MKIFGIIGYSGNGKTTLIEKLIPCLIDKGISVSTIKHTHHKFDIDKPGKDSYRHREAGASEVMLASTERWALLHENRNQQEPEVDELIQKMAPVDLVIIEGFKRNNHPKLEIHRPDEFEKAMWTEDETIKAVATDKPDLVQHDVVLNLDEVDTIADFIMSQLGMN